MVHSSVATVALGQHTGWRNPSARAETAALLATGHGVHPLLGYSQNLCVFRCAGTEPVCKAHRPVYHSTLGWRVIQKKKDRTGWRTALPSAASPSAPAEASTASNDTPDLTPTEHQHWEAGWVSVWVREGVSERGGECACVCARDGEERREDESGHLWRGKWTALSGPQEGERRGF